MKYELNRHSVYDKYWYRRMAENGFAPPPPQGILQTYPIL